MKKLARSFEPGEDRLAGFEVIVREVSGAPVLSKANAFMEIQFVSRMEAGDHCVALHEVGGLVGSVRALSQRNELNRKLKQHPLVSYAIKSVKNTRLFCVLVES